MKKKITPLLIILTLVCTSIQAKTPFAEEKLTIKGTIIDSISNESVPFATISATKQSMPMIAVKRVAADANGKFEFSITTAESLTLKFEAVGMRSITKDISDISAKTIDMGKILLPSNDRLLSELTVTATKPLVKVDLDKITYDMQADPESQTSSTLEMLRKVPMITVDGDENIKVKGQSNFKIFMNGKATNIISNNPSQVLKSIPANSIKSIEVITEPGAKYEAEGLAGIINIVTQSAMKGYTGTLRAGVDNYGAINGGLYFSTKIGKWGITTNLNQGMSKSPESSNETHRKSNEANAYQYLDQLNKGSNSATYRYGSLSMSYEIDSLNLITIEGGGMGGSYSSKNTGNTFIRSASLDTTQAYANISDNAGTWGGYDGSVDYQKSFKKPDKLFTTSYKISYSPSSNDNTTETEPIKNYYNNKQHILSNSSSTEHTFQLDYTEPFNKKHVIEFGGKLIYRINQSENEYYQYNFTGKAWESMPGMTDKGINHTYSILGAYGSYTFRLPTFSARVGGRFERTSASVSYSADSAFNSKPFVNLVPSVTLSYKTSPASNLQLSYTQRISRPDIYYLNPFKNIADPKNISQGNPELQPEISNSFNLSYNQFTPKFNFNTSAYVAFTNNSIEDVSVLQDSVVYTTYENIGKSRNAGVSTYFRWQITPMLNIYFNGSGRYSYYSFYNNGNNIENDGFSFSAYSGAGYMLPKDFRINLNGGYSSPSVMLQSRSYGYYFYRLSVNKSFLQKKLTIGLSANGFLEKFMTLKTTTTTDTYTSETIYQRNSRQISINASYMFGQMKEQIKRVQRGIDNSDVKSGNQQQATSSGQSPTM